MENAPTVNGDGGRFLERQVDGTTVARYGSTGSGDAPEFTTDPNDTVLEITYTLPGGALLTTRPEGNVWSYPNTHGDLVATADQSGTKQGPTRVYDPSGNPVTGDVPDNSAGNLDYGWLGQHQRPLEHEPGLQPTIEMGARQYSPLLGRFTETDPIEGGTTTNDYGYVPDPVNDFDLTGEGGQGSCSNSGRLRTTRRCRRALALARARSRGRCRRDPWQRSPRSSAMIGNCGRSRAHNWIRRTCRRTGTGRWAITGIASSGRLTTKVFRLGSIAGRRVNIAMWVADGICLFG
jgi:RHS repeat-associated protein